MSFANEIKQEIVQMEICDSDKTQLSALLKMLGVYKLNQNGIFIEVANENIAIIRRVVKLLKHFFNIYIEISTMRNMKFGKKNIYIIKILNDVENILQQLHLKDSRGFLNFPDMAFLNSDEKIRQYLSGVFVAVGSINSPENANYHLEFRLDSQEMAEFIISLLKSIYIDAKRIIRRENHVVYVKASEQIGDFLRAMCASQALMKFEDMRIRRDFKNSITRLDNCATANDMKTYRSGQGQLKDIMILQENGLFNFMDEKLRQVALLRIKYPEESLNDLVLLFEEEYHQEISKSGLAHRFRKIKALANK